MIVAIVSISESWQMHRFDSAETLLSWWEENKHLPGDFYTVNCSIPTISDMLFVRQEVHSKGNKWCPWCAKGRNFEFSVKYDLHRCSICHVSEREYWVRKSNGEN